jgi:hypothetical protein
MRMTNMQIRLGLHAAAGVLLCAAVATVVLSLALSYAQVPDADAQAIQPISQDRPLKTLAPLSAFEVVWKLDVRRPLYDAAPVAVAKTPPPPLTFKLAGTVIEKNNSYAMFATSDGKTELKIGGEKVGGAGGVGGAEVLKIEDGAVTLRYYEQTINLKVQQPKG